MSAYAGIYTDMQGLADLRGQARRRPGSALHEAAGQFEALFTKMMLKTMRESSMKSSLFDSNQQSQYMEMFDDQVSLEISRGRGLGIKEMLVRQLGGNEATAPVAPTAKSPAPDFYPRSKREFVDALMPFARQVEKELGVSHKVVIAQAALESGWGRHTMKRSDGSSANSLFGIKADAGWRGDRVAQRTLEFTDGAAERVTARFRAYDSIGDSVRDYGDFIRSNPRYREAIRAGADPHAYARELQRAGYATDPAYAEKIGEILDSDILRAQG